MMIRGAARVGPGSAPGLGAGSEMATEVRIKSVLLMRFVDAGA
jgi:hypothetical protein